MTEDTKEDHTKKQRFNFNNRIDYLETFNHYTVEVTDEKGPLIPTMASIDKVPFFVRYADTLEVPIVNEESGAVTITFNETNYGVVTEEDMEKGCGIWTEAGPFQQLICMVLPRKESTERKGLLSLVQQIEFFRHLEKSGLYKTTPRGAERFVLTDFKYNIFGKKANQGGKGKSITTTLPPANDTFLYCHPTTGIMGRCSSLGALKKITDQARQAYQRLVPPIDAEAIGLALKKTNMVKDNDPYKNSPFESNSASRDSQSRAHGDEDSGFSCMETVVASPDVENGQVTLASIKANTTKEVQPTVQFLVFPAHKVAIRLLPGTFLIFNSLIPHCVSEVVPTPQSPHKEVYLITSYLKSKIVGGNDNKKELTKDQANDYKSASPVVDALRNKRHKKE